MIGLPIFGACFVLAMILGAVSNKTHFCTMGGVSDWINMGDKGRLGAWFLAAAVATLGVVIMEVLEIVTLTDTRPPYRSTTFAWLRHGLGGLMFGVGMTLAGGCTTKNLIRLGGGNLKSLIVLIVIGIGAYLMTMTDFYSVMFYYWMQPLAIDLGEFDLVGQDLGNIFVSAFNFGEPVKIRLVVGVLLALIVGLFILRTVGFRGNGDNLLGGIVVGLCVIGGWYITAGPWGQAWIEVAEWLDERPVGVAVQSFTFVNPIGEILHYFSQPNNILLVTFGMIAVFGVIFGSFIYSLISGQLRFEWFTTWDDFLRHLVGGALMGIGGVLALGCTVGQGITGVSTLALGSFITLGAIILASATTMKIQFYKMVYEEASWFDALISGLVDLHLLPRSLRRLEAI